MADSSFDVRLGPIIDEFLRQTQLGTAPEVSVFAGQFPPFEQPLLDILPTLFLMEHAAPSNSGATPVVTESPQEEIEIENHLIIREVGRGGMGIVYEAIDQSLKRRVAIKVLKRTFLHKNRLERFRREAQSIATLVHPNIVPVFSVGQSQGHHYFSMQFIDGATLDEVISDLRDANLPAEPNCGNRTTVPNSSWSNTIAHRLATITFQQPRAEGITTTSSESKLLSEDQKASRPNEPAASACTSGTITNGGSFYRHAARIGLQVAQAIDYAHKKGILHRDIKPANLILDQNSNAWVADFGLAKEAEIDLTETGEIVGTLRYMSPDRLQGRDDELCDIYAIGASLYELVSLRPAFSAGNRATLLTEILNGQPVSLSKVDRRIPTSLKMIIEKAMSRELSLRYQSAGELADDLHRFLMDRPVLARQASTLQRVRLWARRNPLPSAMLVLVALMMLAITIGSSAFAWTIYQKNILITQSEQRESAANQNAQRRLLDAKMATAKTSLYVPSAGRTVTAQAALDEAIAISQTLEAPPIDFEQRVRDTTLEIGMTFDVISSIGNDDCSPPTAWEATSWGFSSDLNQVVRPSENGELIIREIHGGTDRKIADGYWQEVTAVFSKDDRFIVARGLNQIDGRRDYRLVVWDSHTEKTTLNAIAGGYTAESNFSIAADNSFLVFIDADSKLTLANPINGQILSAEKTEIRPTFLRIDPYGGRLLMGMRPATEIRQYVKSRNQFNLSRPEKVFRDSGTFMDATWHPQGGTFITGTGEGHLQVWDITDADAPKRQYAKHTDAVRNVGFDSTGLRVVTHSDDRTSKIWDFQSGDLLLTLDAGSPQLSRNGRKLLVEYAKQQFAVWDIPVLCCQVLSGKRNLQHATHDLTFSPDGRHLVWANNARLAIHDFSLNRTSSFTDDYHINTQIEFDSKDGTLLAYSDSRIDSLTLTGSGAQDDRSLVRFEKQALVPKQEKSFRFHKAHRSTIATVDGSSRLSILAVGPTKVDPALLSLPAPADQIEISSDGRLAAVWSENAETRLMMIDLENRKVIGTLDVLMPCKIAIENTGKLIAVATVDQVTIYDGVSLKPTFRLPMPQGDPGTPVFSNEGNHLAVAILDRVILFDTASFEQSIVLHSPGERYSDHRFGPATGIEFSPNDELLAVGTRGSQVHLWDIKRILAPQ